MSAKFDTEILKTFFHKLKKGIKMKKLFLTTVALILFMAFNQSIAQNKWTISLRPGVDYATQNIADANLKFGLGADLTIAFRLIPHLAAYTGWSWNHFAVDNSFAGSDASFEETGYSFGLQFIHPFGESGLSYLVKAGLTYNHIEIENNNGDIIIDSGHGLGFQTEAGLVIHLSERFSISPSVRYRSLNRDIKIQNAVASVNLNYISLGVGLSYTF